MTGGDVIRSNVNRVYRGFNADCGERAEQFSAPRVTHPSGTDHFIRLAINPGKGAGYWDVARLSDEMLVCVAECTYLDPFDYIVSPQNDVLSIRMVVSGELEIADRNGARVHVERGAAEITSIPGNYAHEMRILEHERFASLTIHVRTDSLARLMGLGEQETPSMLASFQDPDAGFKSCSMPLTSAMANGVFDLVKAPYSGALRSRFYEAKTMEMLCLFVDAMRQCSDDEQQPGSPSVQALSRAQLARRILEEHFVAPPTVEQLARRVGVNRTRLRHDFKCIFGITIAEFVQARRMEMARQLLRDESISIGVIAEAVGYSHAGNFSAAFRRHFGVSPRDHRRF